MADRAGRVPAGGGPAGGAGDVPGTLALVSRGQRWLARLAFAAALAAVVVGVPPPPSPMHWARLSRQALTFTRPSAMERLCLRD